MAHGEYPQPSFSNWQWDQGVPGHYQCANCGAYVPIVGDLPHTCFLAGGIVTTGTTGTMWSYQCVGCGHYVYTGTGLPLHKCPGAVAVGDDPEECTLCFSLVRRGKMSDHWMNLHHAPKPG